jgi:hypothetical protein
MPEICDLKISTSANDFDILEFKALKCLLMDNYEELLKLFGFDQNKTLFEVERVLGRKLERP